MPQTYRYRLLHLSDTPVEGYSEVEFLAPMAKGETVCLAAKRYRVAAIEHRIGEPRRAPYDTIEYSQCLVAWLTYVELVLVDSAKGNSP